MADIKIERLTGDLMFKGNDLVLTEDTPDDIAQRLYVKFSTFLGEWFLDTNYGIPYYQSILGKNRAKDTIDIIFKNGILDDPEVGHIVEFISSIDPMTRIYSLSFRVKAINGDTTPTIDISV